MLNQENQSQHNLNISTYSLEELLGLFDLTYDLDYEDVKRAKKKVLMLHPDKSRLSSDYFIFYKRAFEVIVHFYEEKTRQNRVVPTEEVKYSPMNTSAHQSKQVNEVINNMKKSEFQNKFNQMFEQNMKTAPDNTRNEWFKKEDPIFDINEKVSTQNMGQVFDTIKQRSMGLVQYKGVESLHSGGGTNIYDDADDNSYVVCDPFSKLKYDDLRKVHKDQTVLAVSEKDYQKVPQYSSVDHFMRERGRQNLTPLEKTQAEKMMQMQQKEYEQTIMQKQYNANLKTMEYAEKNKQVLSNFLRIT
jgi:hypothetical protein